MPERLPALSPEGREKLETVAAEVVEEVMRDLYALHPEWEGRYGPRHHRRAPRRIVHPARGSLGRAPGARGPWARRGRPAGGRRRADPDRPLPPVLLPPPPGGLAGRRHADGGPRDREPP